MKINILILLPDHLQKRMFYFFDSFYCIPFIFSLFHSGSISSVHALNNVGEGAALVHPAVDFYCLCHLVFK